MSQPWQQPPPGGGFGQPQQPPPQPGYGYPQPAVAPGPGYGYPQQQPAPGVPGYPGQPGYSGDQPAFYPGPPPPPPVGGRKNVGGAVALAVLGALLGGVVYAVLLNALFDDTDGFVAIGWAAVLVGIAAGLGPGLMGGRNWGLVVFGAALAFVGVVLGDLYGMALVFADLTSSFGGPGANEIFFENFGDLWETWTEANQAVDYLVLLLAPAAAVAVGGLCFAKQQAQLPQ